MRIGVDIDDTLTSLSELFYTEMQKWCIEREEIDNCDKKVLTKNVYANIKEYHSFWKEVMEEKVLNMECKDGAKLIIDKLLEEGHEIYLITARSNDYYDNYKENTVKWLKSKKINYTNIFFECTDKRKVLSELKIDVMIDDNKEVMDTVLDLNIKGIIMNTFFNSTYNKCDRAYTWYDVYCYIKN